MRGRLNLFFAENKPKPFARLILFILIVRTQGEIAMIMGNNCRQLELEEPQSHFRAVAKFENAAK